MIKLLGIEVMLTVGSRYYEIGTALKEPDATGQVVESNVKIANIRKTKSGAIIYFSDGRSIRYFNTPVMMLWGEETNGSRTCEAS